MLKIAALQHKTMAHGVHFDAYAFTVHAPVREVVELIHNEAGSGLVEREAGVQGYDLRLIVRGEDGHVLATVKAGGLHQWPHVDAQGPGSEIVATVARAAWPGHLVTRADAAIDFEEEGAFARCVNVARDIAARRRMQVPVAGDWVNAIKGRTQYIGAPSSDSRGRIYEKGHEQYYARGAKELRPHWARVEVQQRPKKERREIASRLSAEEVFAMSPWSAELLREVAALDLASIPAPRRHALNLDASMRAMMLQYGPKFSQLVEREGSPCLAGQFLEQMRRRILSEK